jgi:cap1 methyltransferase
LYFLIWRISQKCTLPFQRSLLAPGELLYFADVCAGPGGFSEYVLWRKAPGDTKGFGFTLKGSHDFKLEDFYSTHSEFFEPHYGMVKSILIFSYLDIFSTGKGGLDGDGNVYNPENLQEFQDFVLNNTDQRGVHFVMADGVYIPC